MAKQSLELSNCTGHPNVHKVKRARGERLFQMFRTSTRINFHLLIFECYWSHLCRIHNRESNKKSCLAYVSIVSYLGFPLLFAEGRNAALVYSMLFQGSAITSKCVNEYKALEIPTSVCLPVCFSFCTLTFSPSVTSLHKWKLHIEASIYIGVGYLLSVLHSVTSRHMDICT